MKTPNEVLKYYDAELQQYANKVVAPFNQYLDRSVAPFRPFFKYLFDYYLFLSYCADNGIIKSDEQYAPARVLFAKSCLAYYGVYVSLQNGLPTEAITSLRSLLEVYFNVKLLFEKDTENRLTLFRNYQIVEQWLNIQANKDLVARGKMTQEMLDKTYSSKMILEIENQYQTVKSDYHPQRPYHWAWKIFSGGDVKINNPSIKTIAKHVDLEIDFVKVYSSTSLSVHGSHNLINILEESGSISISPKFSNMIYTDGCLAMDYMSHIFLTIVRYFKFQNPDEIELYDSHFALAILDETKKGAP